MKTHWNCAILAATLMSFGAAVGSAQTITANIPFGFHITNTEMPAGLYSVKQLGNGSPVLLLNNWRAGKSAMVVASPVSASGDTRPRLIFLCGEYCTLTEVWGATSYAGVQVPSQRKPRNGERLTVVYFGRNGAGN